MATAHPYHPRLAAQEFASTAMGRSLLAGRLVATAVSNQDGRHITVRFSAKSPGENGGRWRLVPLAQAKRVYVDIPGQDLKPGDNVGNFDPAQSVMWATNSDQRRVNAARYILLAAAGRVAGDRVLQQTNCFYCGRPLTDPVSIERGIGPVCFGKTTGSQHEVKNADDFLAALTEPEPEPTPVAPAPAEPIFTTLAPGQDPRSV